MLIWKIQQEIQNARQTLTAEILGLQRQLTIKQQDSKTTDEEIKEIRDKLSSLADRVDRLQTLIGKLNERLLYYKKVNEELSDSIANKQDQHNAETTQKYQQLIIDSFTLINHDKKMSEFEMDGILDDIDNISCFVDSILLKHELYSNIADNFDE